MNRVSRIGICKMYKAIICCALVAFVVYVPTLKGGFTYDDAPAIEKNPDVHGKTPLSQIFFDDFWGNPLAHPGSHKSYRPLCTLSYRLNHLFGELEPFGYHLVNVLLHAIATALVTYTASRLFHKFIPSLITGLLFACHPIHTEAVAGIVGRADIGACIFFLLSFNCYMSYCITRDTRPQSGRTRYLLLSIVFTMMSMLTKEQGITVLALNVMFDITYNYHLRKWLKLQDIFKIFKSPSFMGVASQTLCGIILISLRLTIMKGSANFAPADNPASSSNSSLTKVLTFSYLPAFNLWLLLNPYSLCFDWTIDSIPVIDSIYDIRNLMSLVFYSTSVPFALYISREMEIERMYLTMFKGLTDKSEEDVKGANGVNRKNCKSDTVKRRRGFRRSFMSSKRQVHYAGDLNDNIDSTEEEISVTEHVLVIVMSLSILIFPFIPASNIFFYVGFVVAERILYIPSIGFCLLIAMGLYQFYIEYLRCRLINPHDLVTKLCGLWYYSSLILTLALYIMRTIERNGDWYSNESLFRSGIGINPAKAWSNLATTLKEQGRLNEAEQAYLQGLRHHPEWTDVNYNYAVFLQDAHKYEAAISQYRLAVKSHPNMALAYLNLGFVLDNLKRDDEAEEVYRYTASLDANYSRDPIQQLTGIVSALCYLGKMMLKQGRYQEAVDSFEEALKKRTDSYDPSNIYNMLGESYFQLKNYEYAELNYKKSLSFHPNNGKTYLAYALLLESMEKQAESEANFLKAISLEPRNMQIYEYYTKFLNAQGRQQDIIDMLTRALDDMPDVYHLNFYMATTLSAMGYHKQAEPYFRKIVDLQPDDPTSLRNYGAILHINQKPEESIPYYERSLKLQPNDSVTLDNLRKARGKIKIKNQGEARELLTKAIALREAGKTVEAEGLFREIVDLTPEDARAHSNLGAILHINRKLEEAERAYIKALEIKPDDTITKNNIVKVQNKIKMKTNPEKSEKESL